ncbi:MAG: hypothetical protein LBB19_02735, partial [Puniceicoccales bacterium]|nr:hypothetical protein [Puniceicoccales bacterium]
MPIDVNNTSFTPTVPLSAPKGGQGIEENSRTETGIRNKVQEAKFQKATNLASFAESTIKLRGLRDNREGQSGIYKSLFRHGEKNEIKKLQSEIRSHIKHYKFAHNQSDSDAVKAWIMCARDASSKDKEVICNTIRDKLLAPGHQFNPNILKQLHELAGHDQDIQSIRDNYLQRSFENPPSIRITQDDLRAINARIIQNSNSKDPATFSQMQDAALSELQTQRTNRYIGTVKVWLEIANTTSSKTQQQAMYAQIQTTLNKGDYVPELLTLLNEQANAKENKNNPLIAALRNAYVEAKSDQGLGGFHQGLTAALNGSTEDKIAFIKQFEGNLSLNNQPLQIRQEEQAAIKALLAKDNLTPPNRVFLQQMDLAYEMKLNENNPKKMLELASRFMELERPLLQQV